MRKLFFILLFLPLLSQSQEINFHGLAPFTFTSVFDGDGGKGIFFTGQKDEIRLTGVDAPEKRGYSTVAQAYGNEAGDSLRAMIKGKTVYLDTLTMKGNIQRDQYGRLLAIVYLEDATNVNFEVVNRGWAWNERVSYMRIPRFNAVLLKAKKEAKAAKRGLWDGENIHTPKYHRKRYSIFR